ncbi:glycosyltransferase [Anaerosinus sp.]|uniref:glycosyltransferase n=1 Tax=Selenobaculum sp. TaxID=3074374 RepID=UPI0015A76CF5
MKISACIIAKDEADNIRECIDSLKKQVDEIILVDTGSTDNTIAIAKNCGAKVLQYQWENDFSKARNFAIEQVSCDWIVFLDADEYLVLPKKDKLRDCLKFVDSKYNAILSKLINIDVDKQNKVLDFFYTIRIFRHQCGLNYQGKIHEQLQGQLGEFVKAVKLNDDKAVIYHTGYSTHRLIDKSKRNIIMLKQEIVGGNTNYLNYRHLAECYANIEEHSQALIYLRKALSMPKIKTTYESRFYQVYLVTLRECKLNNTDEFYEVLQEAIANCPDLPDFHAEYAALLYNNGKYTKALAELKLAIELNNTYIGNEPSFFAEKAEDTLIFKQLLESKIKQNLKEIPTNVGNEFALEDLSMSMNSDLQMKQYQQLHTAMLSKIHSRFIDIIILYLLTPDLTSKVKLLKNLPRDLAEVFIYWQNRQVMPDSKLELLGTVFKHLAIRCPRRDLIVFLRQLRMKCSVASMNFAKVLSDNQFYSEAIVIFEQAEQLEEQYLIAYGICYYQLGQYQKAREIFQRLDNNIANSYLIWLNQAVKK